jgi:hypothetical protein
MFKVLFFVILVLSVCSAFDDEYDEITTNSTAADTFTPAKTVSTSSNSTSSSSTSSTTTINGSGEVRGGKIPSASKPREVPPTSRIVVDIDGGNSEAVPSPDYPPPRNPAVDENQAALAPPIEGGATGPNPSPHANTTVNSAPTTTTPPRKCLVESVLITRLLEQNDELGKALYEMWVASEGLKLITKPTTTTTTTTTATTTNLFKIDDTDFEWFEIVEATSTTKRIERDFPDPKGHVRIFYLNF